MTTPEEILKEFDNKIDAVVDEGRTKIGIPSTVVKVEKGEISILREGNIAKEEIVNKVYR